MAIIKDKSRTPAWMKVLIILLAGAFVLGVAGVAFSGCSAPAPSQTAGQAGGSEATTGTLDALAKSWGKAATSNEAELRKKPGDYTLLVRQANIYHDWAGEVAQLEAENPALGGSSAPIWQSSISFYKQALQVKPGDPNVETDLAIATFYSGDTASAIKLGESVRKRSPKFAAVHFNLGIFYETAERSADAIAAFKEYLRLEPNGQLAQFAKERMTALQGSGGKTTPKP